jgi:outer membrane protein assembly factor BamA
MRLLLFIFFCLTEAAPCMAQDSAIATQKNNAVVINNIFLAGNKRTKSFIILREVPFVKGAELTESDLEKQLVLTRQQVMNTLLFVDVNVYIAARNGNEVDINIDVKERWYFFPLPYFRLVDRNFNQWWVEQNRSFERVNYGIKFTQNNISGRNDNLDIWLITGYTQQITLRYNLPFFDKKLKQGFNIGIISARQRHMFRVSYNDERVADTVLKINPLYFPDQQTRMQFVDFTYTYRYYNVDYRSYPTSGFFGEASLYKRALDNTNSIWQLSGRAVYVKPLAKDLFLHFEGLAIAKAPFRSFFVNEKLIGYGFYQMRGLEYNVVDGMIGGALKTTLAKQVFSFILRNPFPSKTHDKIPIRFFLKAYGDMGYSYNPSPRISNTLNNTMLRTWGFGMDIVSIYDFVFKIEYSFNQLGKDGLYLQTRNDF